MMMDSNDKLGQIKEGYLADLLLVDGDPLADLSVLPKADRLVMIMKNGELYKHTRSAAPQRAVA